MLSPAAAIEGLVILAALFSFFVDYVAGLTRNRGYFEGSTVVRSRTAKFLDYAVGGRASPA